MDQQLLQEMIEKVGAQTTGEAASMLLAQTVCHVVTKNAAKLSAATQMTLSTSLTEKLTGGAPGLAADTLVSLDLATARHLQESLQRLSPAESLQAVQAF